MIYPKIPLAQSIIEICLAKGITNIIISPGSRNAPLTIGFAQNPNFTCYSIADERCAAFFALGIAQQIKKPTAIICTSGSALLNYYPAFAEAFYSQIPLIVISADRLINSGEKTNIKLVCASIESNMVCNDVFFAFTSTNAVLIFCPLTGLAFNTCKQGVTSKIKFTTETRIIK